MSETTLTKDEITELRRKCPTHGQLGLNGEMLTKLLDAAEHAETLQAQLTEVTRESVTRAQAAEMLARVAHRGQKELFGGDYIVHLDRVVALLATDDEKTVGWLHDIIEDCAVSHAELVKWFGPKIADTVCTLSRNPQATYLDYIDSIRDSGNTVAIAVKRADLLDHLRPETFHRLPAELRARYEAALAMFPESAPTPR